MILDATILSHYQSCKRRTVLESEFRPRKWRPRILFERWLRYGVFALSNGCDPASTISHCKSQFMLACSDPGLDVVAFPYVQARDWAAALHTVLLAASNLTLLALRQAPPVEIAEGVRWRVLSPQDESGTLHRWIAVSRWDEDELARQAHGWWSFGDMTVTRQNLMLHVVEVGSLRGGSATTAPRRDSVWTRAYRHPAIPHLKLMFRRADGSEAFGGRIPVYLADLSHAQQSLESWVEQLFREGLVKEKMKHITLACPGEEVCADAVSQIVQEARAIQSLPKASGQESQSSSPDQGHASRYWELPMSHSACDSLSPCPWQQVCYQPARLSREAILDLGPYAELEASSGQRTYVPGSPESGASPIAGRPGPSMGQARELESTGRAADR